MGIRGKIWSSPKTRSYMTEKMVPSRNYFCDGNSATVGVMAENRHQSIFNDENWFYMAQVVRHKKPPYCSVGSSMSSRDCTSMLLNFRIESASPGNCKGKHHPPLQNLAPAPEHPSYGIELGMTLFAWFTFSFDISPKIVKKHGFTNRKVSSA